MVKDDFFDDLIYFDKNHIDDEVFQMLTKIVQFETFNPTYIQRSSRAAAGLCAWILAVYEYAKIARSQSTKLEEMKAYQELFNKVFLFLFFHHCFSSRQFLLASTYFGRKTTLCRKIEE